MSDNNPTQAGPQSPSSAAPEADQARESATIAGWNDTHHEYPLDLCLQQLIEQQVERSPDAVALCFDEQRLSFSQLNRRANRLAHYLRELGVGPDSLVGVQMERSLELMIALLAILKAGGAYLPLDPGYPEERLALLIEDASVGVVLTQQRFAHRLAAYGIEVLCLDDPASEELHACEDNPAPVNRPEDLAYVIYTSGSTGRPKGCMLPHKAICNRLLWMQRHYGVGPQDRILQKTPFTFDVSVWELFLPLLSGACLVMARPEGHKDAHYLVELIQARQITICHFVPSMLRFFLKHPTVGECRSLDKVFVSGEALTHELLLQFRARLQARLHNLYGPTEAAVDVTWWPAEPRPDRRVPIGRPIDNIQIHILDAEANPLPIGQTGELCIGGVGLARGYLNRPQLTAEKFIRDPFCAAPDARLYRTGDEARFLDNGEIEVLGRFDSQVKLRGFRIELGEIESTLNSHPAISDAVVLVQDAAGEDPKLVAYVVADGLDKKAVRDFVKSRLPEYMTPNRVQFVEQIPVTAHGKADRQALLATDGPAPDSRRAATLDPQALSAWLQAYFIEALGIDELAVDDDLFDQGATSFTLVQAVHSIHQQYQVTLPVEIFLEQPSIAAVIAFILDSNPASVDRPGVATTCPTPPSDAPEPIQLQRVDFDPRAYQRLVQVAPPSLERLGGLLSLLREVTLAGQGKYLYSSAGGLNAIQCYLYVAPGQVEGLPSGTWYYQPRLNRLLPIRVPADPGSPALAEAGFALFLVAQMAAIEPLYNHAAPALLVLEAGYIEQLLLSHQAGFDLALVPSQDVDAASVAQLCKLEPSHRVLHCLIPGDSGGAASGRSGLRFDDFLAASNNGFDLPGKDALERLHQQQRQIRSDLLQHGAVGIDLPAAPISADALQLRAAKRQYGDQALSVAQLSRLLSLLRAGPDARHLYHADALQDLEIYLQLAAGSDQAQAQCPPPGLYRYHADSHSLSPLGEGDPLAFNRSYTPFNRKHAQQARLRIFLVSARSAGNDPERRYRHLLQAGRIGQLLLEQQTEFGIGLCPIGSMYFDKVRSAFHLDEHQELLHSFVGGAVSQGLPPGWPRLELQPELGNEDEAWAAREPENAGALAIIGLSGRYPGAADPRELWHNLRAGRSSIQTLSRQALLHDAPGAADSPQWAVGALADKQLFDPLLFKITPAEAKTLDPQERLFLQAVWHCLENSGYTAAGLQRRAERVGVFVGAMWGDYQHHRPGDQGERATSFHSAIANRVSFFNDFSGSSVVFDTSCSSAMTALHFACTSLRQGECQAAIVGGVNLISHPSHLELLSALQLLSAEGQAHPFGLHANGWVAGEGVGALLIRPLEDARRDGDRILGVIRATAISHSGKTFRYGMPNAEIQAASMRRALEQAGLSAEAIGYVEAAAPGASLADGAEFAALAKVFGHRQGDTPLPVGSIKANIGHLESASALSQITKVLLQFEHRQIAPTLGCVPLSPLIGPEHKQLLIADTLRDWQGPRRALINAFGASGSAGHLILEAPPPEVAAPEQRGPWLFPFSAASAAQLEQLLGAFADDLQAGRLGDARLGDISYTLCVGRVALGQRLALVADSESELLTLLKAASECSTRCGSDARAAPPLATEADLRGLDRAALSTIGQRWVAGDTDLSQIARHDWRRVALAAYPFAGLDCHIATGAAEDEAATPVTDPRLQTALEGYLTQHFSKVSAIPESSIDSLESFDRYGLTSLMITTLNQRLAQAFGDLPSTLFFEHQSISALANWFAARHPSRSRQLLGVQAPAAAAAQAAPASRAAPRPDSERRHEHAEPIAIIGLAGRFPGAPDIDSFWDNLKNAVDSISEIPGERWQHQPYYSPDRSQKGKINTKWGGFIDAVDRFDPLFFNISPRDAERMDPQERIFLETAWHTLEDAGYDRAGLQRHYQGKMGVFVGVMHGEYLLYTRSAAADCTDDAVDSSFGSIANRVSYVFDCTGPSMAVDTICSSSLTALHLAVQSLQRGECRVALAGGVNLSLHPNKYFIQSQLTMSSSDGRCRSFGEGGDGFVPGEGAGAVLLKPLSQAQADGDNIYGVIRATSLNHNGKTHGYTVPSPNAQGAMIAESLEKAGMDPRELSYIEAHGTGTALGDPIEISGLQQGFARRSAALGREPAGAQQCALGSAKSNIGHLESAAGIAGVAKVLLQLKHRQLVASLHSSRLNPGIAFGQSPFHIPQQLQEWRQPRLNLDGQERDYPLAASVSSFGSGGSNGHVIIAQYLAPEREAPVAGPPAIIVLSARTPLQLQQQIERLQQCLLRREREGQLPRLADLALTLQQGREAMEYRLAFTAASISELQERLAQGLEQWLKAPEHFGCFDGVHLGRVQENKAAMAVLAHDEDMQATLAAWADKGKYAKLLELWVRGLTFDWALLGAPLGSARRISLPGYPFARERIWVSGDLQLPPPVQGLGEARLHPLLQRNVSDLTQQKFTSVFSGQEFFLRDHRVHEHKVLPGVAYLEMAREAVSRSLGDQALAGAVSLCHLVWSQPLTLSEQDQAPVTLEVQINAVDAHRLTFAILQQQTQALCCQGEAQWRQDPMEPLASLASLQARINGPCLDAEALYRQFDSVGIHYGPSHRTVRELHSSGGQLLAQIQLPPSLKADHRQFVLHPSLMDGALQCTLGLLVADPLAQGATVQRQQTRVPFALDRLEHSGAALGEQVWAWVRPVAQASAAGHWVFDIDIYNQQGEHCVALHGFALREMKAPSALEVMLDDRGQTDACLLEKWQRVEPQPLPSGAARVLLIANDPQGLQQLTARYPQRASMLLDGSESIETLAARLREAGPLEHLLWLAPSAMAAHTSAEQLIHAQQSGVLSCFRLIKALLLLGLDQQPLAWTLITRATLTVFGAASPLQQAADEPVAPAHASLHGLMGGLAKEYSHWPVCVVDLPAGDSWPSLDPLSLPADPRGEPLACRDDVWYRPYLAPCLVPLERGGEGESLYRDAGVYLVVGGAGGIGRLWSEHLIRTRGAQVIWLGRRPQDARIDAAISELARLGPAPRYISADAGNHAALQQAVTQVLAEHGRIHGVIHAAIQLEDQSLARMQPQKFAAGLAAKVDVCARLAEVFEHQPLDFMLFFSSLQSYTKSAGQSNYAAGCTFKNAFAQALGQQRGYPVKVINWGYWGDVGSVASDDYRRRMAEVGLGSIDGKQAMRALDALLGAPDDGAPLSQLTFLRTCGRLSETFEHLGLARHPGGLFGEYGEVRAPAYPSLIGRLHGLRPDSRQVRGVVGQVQAQRAALDELQVRLLYAQLQQLGLFTQACESLARLQQHSPVLPLYRRWFAKSLEELAQRGYVQLEGDTCRVANPQPLDLEALWQEWARQQPAWLEHPSLKAEALLAEATLRVLPQILDGRIAATDVLFPDASMSRVEGIYKHNPVSDFFNEVLLDAMLEFVRGRLEQDPRASIRILEIGAGTGGTSARAFEKLQPLQAQIAEYCYTDVSQAFLMHAQQAYGPHAPYLSYQLFDVDQPLAAQGIKAGAYDLVIATNVLHATPDLRRALKNAKAALKHNGLLLINEIARNGLFTHLTFGLLKGWWLFDDPQHRLPGGPALAPRQWKQVLESEGYRQVHFPALAEHDLGQQIVIAQSNGLVWQERPERAEAPRIAPVRRETVVAQAPLAPRAPQPGISPAALGEVSSSRLKAETVRYLKQVIGGLFKIEPEQIDAREALETYGIDSILVVQLTNLLRDQLAGVSSTLFFEYQTIEALAEHFLATQKDRLQQLLGLDPAPASGAPPARAPVEPLFTPVPSRFAKRPPEPPAAQQRYSDVAIVGLSGRYAGSDNVRQLWQHLKAGEHCIAQVPAERWDWRRYFDRTPGTAGRIYTPWGGFIGQIDRFDPLFFHISPREALKMDPQERLFLEEAYHCISDAGYTPARLAERQRVGVFVGVMNGTYSHQSSYWSVANRVSYQFNFQGPSLAVDTACSSSITALHLALQSLERGDSDCALVGGVSLLVDPVHYMGLSEMQMLSPGPHCKAFGADADGFVAGEGVGALLLKPLAQAEADGDRIYGVIKGSMINAGGKTNGYTVPNPLAQSRLVVDSLARAGVDARAVSYVEAHGTGTALGDPIEIAGLARAFSSSGATPGTQYCAIGSIKSNIGHCESAAGIAGITKVLLQLQHRQLVPSLHADTANPHIDFANTPFAVQRTLAEWPRPQVLIDGVPQTFKRIATVSSFGAGGANAHVVIEEYEDLRVRPPRVVDEQRPVLMLLSAKSAEQLLQQARLLLDELAQGPLVEADLPALAFTLQVAREAMEHRHGWWVSSLAQLKAGLEQLLSAGVTSGRGRQKPEAQAPDFDIGRVLDAGAQQRLLDAWLDGAVLDWQLMYPQGTPAPLSLPGYPFARERYWQTPLAAAGVPGAVEERLHPLLHRNVSDLRGLRYLSRFSGSESLLAEHQVNGQGVLPGAALVSLIQAALSNALGAPVPAGRALVIEDLAWRQPFSVDAANNGELFLELTMPAQGEYQVGIYSYDPDAQLQLHAQARARYAVVVAPGLEFNGLGARVVEVEACYQRFAAMGIEYGQGYRRLLSLERQDDQVLARIALQDPALTDGFALHPALLDGAMQGVMALLLEELGDTPALLLPATLGQCVLFADCPAALQVQIRRSGSTTDGHLFDLALFDEHGQCCATLHQLAFRTLSDHRQGASTALLCHKQWDDALPATALATPGVAHRVLSLGHHRAFADLAQGLQARGIGHCALPATDYPQAALALAEQLQALLGAAQPCLIQLLVPADDAQGYRGLGGLLSSVSREQPALIGQLIEVAPALEAPQLLSALAAEAAAPNECVLRYLAQAGTLRRQQLSWQPQPLDAAPAPWRPDGVYLISGGLGGVGAVMAQALLAAAPQARVVLCGRTPAGDPAVRAKLAQLGEAVDYRAVDLANAAQVERLISDLVADYGALHGILHCAGITRDALLADKPRADFAAVFAAKVDGVQHLDRSSAGLALDFFVLYSSIASVLGNAGQTDYAAANGYLDAFASLRNRQVAAGTRHGRTLAINWPLWLEGGLHMSDTARRLLAQRSGIEAMASATGVQAFYHALQRDDDQLMVLAGDREKLLALLRPPAPVAVEQAPLEGEALLPWLRQLLARTLKIRPERLDNEVPFEQYGIDSLMIMEMTAVLEKRFGALSRTLFFQYPSLQALVEHLATRPMRSAPQTSTSAQLRTLLASALHTPPEQIDEQRCFEDFGIDSVQVLELTRRLEGHFGALPPGLLFEYSSLHALAGYLASTAAQAPGEPLPSAPAPQRRLFDKPWSPQPSSAASRDDIAIIGIAGRYPGAPTLEAFWENLSQGRNSIGEVPPERWDWRDYYSSDRGQSGVHNSKWGGFIDGIDQFDPLFFNISPLEAELIDPQERLFLQTAWAAMEDAGYSRQLGAGTPEPMLQVGVYAGVMYSEYQLLGAEASLRGERMGFAGSSASIANRVSFCLNLQGPSLSLDSMCSSSLTALHLACQDLHSGRTAMAIAGGVNLTLHPNKYLMLSSGQFISNQGQCASFGEGGDGYVPGEGVGVVVLKRLADAERDGDQIHGLIKGSYLNHGGKSTGYSVPDPRAQQAAISGALKDANVDPAAISYIEAHGTGTRLGDPIEIAGLANALGPRAAGQTCWIGSVKSNIGHCEAAAGIAGLTKVLLQLKHGKIAPSLHSRTLNPFIDFAATPFEVNQHLRDWPQPSDEGRLQPRIAGLSSFGAGGSNAHLIVAQYAGTRPQPEPDGRPQMILLSAREPGQLRQIASRLLEHLQHAPQRLDAIAWTLQVGREAMEHRAALIATDAQQLLDALRGLAGGDDRGWICGDTQTGSAALEPFKNRSRTLQHEHLAQLYANGELQALLALWSAGLRIDWNALRAPDRQRPQRISLPTYPFATERYWAPTAAKGLPAATRVHPWLHSHTATGDGHQFTCLCNGEEPWLLDHVVNASKTLPGAACLEIIRAAVSQARGDGQARAMVIEQLNWLAPLTVGSAPRCLRVNLQALDGHWVVTLLSDDDAGAQPVLHCQARVTGEAAPAAERLDLAHWRERPWQRRLDSDEVYRLFDAMGLAYGASHRGIRQLLIAQQGSRREVLAQLDLEGIQAVGDCWLEPGMTDSALQAAIGMLLPLDAGPAAPLSLLMPFALQRLEILAPCTRQMWALLRGDRHDSAGRIDIELCDQQGQLCARLEGFCARSLGPLLQQPPATPVQQLLAPVWSVVEAQQQPRPDEQGAMLIFGVSPSRHQALAGLYPRARLVPGGPDSAATELLADAEWAEVMWLAPAVEADADPVAGQQQGVLALFRLIKALLNQGYGRRPLRLSLITDRAVSTGPGDPCQAVHAAVHGLAGSLAKEYPHWTVHLADLADEQLDRLATAPFAALASGELLALRHGQWRQRQLARVQAASVPARLPVYRDGGVYLVIGGAGGIGAVWSQHLIRQHRARVVWIGRRALDAQIAAKLDELTAISLMHAGPAPVYLQADATDHLQLAAARQQIIERFGPINGVVHSAIVLKDYSLANMDESTFSQVLEAKVATSVALARAFGDSAAQLDFVLFFSSMMSFTTAAGQGNYAAGCTFADAFADQLRARWSCPVKVINWGYWGGVGSVSDARYRERMKALGLGSIEPEEGLRALEQLLVGGLDQLALLALLPGSDIDAIDSLAGLLGHEQIRLSSHRSGAMAALQERLEQRLAALVAIT